MNVAESEVVASVMQRAGYEICEKEEEADEMCIRDRKTSSLHSMSTCTR